MHQNLIKRQMDYALNQNKAVYTSQQNVQYKLSM